MRRTHVGGGGRAPGISRRRGIPKPPPSVQRIPPPRGCAHGQWRCERRRRCVRERTTACATHAAGAACARGSRCSRAACCGASARVRRSTSVPQHRSSAPSIDGSNDGHGEPAGASLHSSFPSSDPASSPKLAPDGEIFLHSSALLDRAPRIDPRPRRSFSCPATPPPLAGHLRGWRI